MKTLKYFKFPLFLLALSLFSSVSGDTAPVKIFEDTGKFSLAKLPEKDRTPGCSGVLTLPSIGLFYKAFEQVLDNERCVWTIAVPNAINYTLDIQYIGTPTNVPGSGQELVLTAIEYGVAGTWPNVTTYIPTGTGSLTILNANVLIVTFHSGTLKGRPSSGFALQYQYGRAEADMFVPSNFSKHYIQSNEEYEFLYPGGSSNYADNELATIIAPTANLKYSGGSNRVWLKSSQLGTTCMDAVFVYVYNSTSETSKWERSGEKFCESEISRNIPHDDMIMLVFKSDASSNYEGFWTTNFSC